MKKLNIKLSYISQFIQMNINFMIKIWGKNFIFIFKNAAKESVTTFEQKIGARGRANYSLRVVSREISICKE